MERALFLDRDGVVCEALPRGEYLTSLEEFILLPGITELLTASHEKGFLNVVVTNQPQIAKGLISEAELENIHTEMQEQLPKLIDKVYYCPHVGADLCDCRKPLPGMLDRAIEELDIEMHGSYMIGDSDKDVGAGKAAGCKTIFVRNDHNADELAKCTPDFVIEELNEAIALLQ